VPVGEPVQIGALPAAARLDAPVPLVDRLMVGEASGCAGDGVFDERLTTGKARWEVGWLGGIRPIGIDNGVWGTGNQFEMTGAGPYAGEPADFVEAVVVRGPAGAPGPNIYGLRTPGWMLFPTQLPDQTEKRVAPGLFRAATRGTTWREIRTWSKAETTGADVAAFNRLIQSGGKVVVPARTRLQAIWDLGRYHCAYPEVKLGKGGCGARVAWTWTESPRDPESGRKGDRGALVGKVVQGYGDEFISDGQGGVFSAPWFRCGRWCRIDVETGDEPLEIEGLALIASRYPLEMESIFTSPDDASLEDIRRICARAMQMCAHEMLFDCPYYEQQMYPGDTRVQLNVIRAMTRDDRLIKRAIEIYDLATRDDGMCPMNFPTRGLQESLTYTLCYLCMYGDYVMNHADRTWLAARIPGLRKSMAGVERYENAEGLIEDPAGWSFMDWVPEWDKRSGVAPNGSVGEGVNAQNNLFWVLAMQSAAVTERALGHETMARYWDEKCTALKAKIIETFWSGERGLIADTVAKDDFSEHSQCLALLGDVLPADKAGRVAQHLVEDADLKRCTVYFSYYLFEAYFKIGRADLFLKRLDLWRDYLKIGVTTLLEAPENETHEARSDCHAWGAHPIWLMQTGLAGIRSAAPFFAKVVVAPQPGSLGSFTATHPHPGGEIRVKLAFADGRATGTVETPVAGDFVYGNQKLALRPGLNEIR
jgi:alpha-L-rhamnosidase